MRHFVMTRSSYGPEWSRDINRARFKITRGITARLLRKQGVHDWTWLVMLDGRDPLLNDRIKLAEDTAPQFLMILWTPGEDIAAAPWDKHPEGLSRAQRVAATAYKHPGWLTLTGPRDVPTLQTRLDDDDGLAVDYFKRVRRATAGLTQRTALMLPIGYRVWNGRYSVAEHDTNAMHSLWTPAGDTTTIYDYGHRLVGRGQPVKEVDRSPGWLWVRHPHTISGWKKADLPLTSSVRNRFPIDWSVLE